MLSGCKSSAGFLSLSTFLWKAWSRSQVQIGQRTDYRLGRHGMIQNNTFSRKRKKWGRNGTLAEEISVSIVYSTQNYLTFVSFVSFPLSGVRTDCPGRNFTPPNDHCTKLHRSKFLFSPSVSLFSIAFTFVYNFLHRSTCPDPFSHRSSITRAGGE